MGFIFNKLIILIHVIWTYVSCFFLTPCTERGTDFREKQILADTLHIGIEINLGSLYEYLWYQSTHKY